MQSTTTTTFQSYDGTHFGILYGQSATTISISQSLTNLIAGASYTLTYYYNVVQASSLVCKLTISIGEQVVDTLSSPTVETGGYLSRSVAYTAVQQTAVVQFALVCPLVAQVAVQSSFALDGITLVTAYAVRC